MASLDWAVGFYLAHACEQENLAMNRKRDPLDDLRTLSELITYLKKIEGPILPAQYKLIRDKLENAAISYNDDCRVAADDSYDVKVHLILHQHTFEVLVPLQIVILQLLSMKTRAIWLTRHVKPVLINKMVQMSCTGVMMINCPCSLIVHLLHNTEDDFPLFLDNADWHLPVEIRLCRIEAAAEEEVIICPVPAAYLLLECEQLLHGKNIIEVVVIAAALAPFEIWAQPWIVTNEEGVSLLGALDRIAARFDNKFFAAASFSTLLMRYAIISACCRGLGITQYRRPLGPLAERLATALELEADAHRKTARDVLKRELQEREVAARSALELVQREQLDLQQQVASTRANWDAEAKLIQQVQEQLQEIVKVNVGGSVFVTSRATLTKCPDSMLAALFSGRYKLVKLDDAIFIDRDPQHFKTILNWLRDNNPAVLPDAQHDRQGLLAEAQYYCLSPLVSILQPKKI